MGTITAPTLERSAALLAEAEAAAVVFMAALAAQGLKLIRAALNLWEDVQVTPTKTNPSSARWLAKVLALVASSRKSSRELAYSYYRYNRALRTGYTVPALNAPNNRTVEDLSDLRDDFYTQVGKTDKALVPKTTQHSDATIKVDDLPDLDDELDALDKQADIEARDVLVNLGPLNLQKMLLEINDDEPATTVDPQRVAAHQHAGSRQAAAAERVVLNAGRDSIIAVAQKDKRVRGYVRLSRTGTPCGWCAMLISRGPVYRTETSGEFVGSAPRGTRAPGETFHDNCHCYTEVVYTDTQYDDSKLYDLNRQYAKEYPKVTKGLNGKAALTAWRRYIRDQQKTSAQEAA